MANQAHIRIKDIAKKAGCSIGTVDRVIHNRGKVAEPVRERILQIIKELHYKPNVNARVLATKHTLVLGILLPSYKKGEYWELPRLGIEEAIERYNEQGYNIDARWFTYNNTEKFHQAGMKMISEEIDGIILNPATYKESVRLVRSFFQNNKPFILIDSDIHGTPSLSFIGKDPVQSGLTVAKLIHQMTRHIAGKKKVWIINLTISPNQSYALLAREIGFMNYFADKDLQENYSFQTIDMDDAGTQQAVDRQIEALLATENPQAIYVTGSRVHKVAGSMKKFKPDPRPLLIGHDLIPRNIQRVRDESIDFLIEEEARRQGYLAVESMIRSLTYKETIQKKQMMNLMIYTRENLPL
jgi:LacI family transcriptional regulator, galactose operon repressor